jgi:predicted dehydrogenase
MALKLVNLGVPTLIEKPIAFSVEEALEIAEAFESRSILGAVGHTERYNPAIIALREQLETGVLGKIFQITTRRVGPYSGRIRDVGVVKDLATHDIDLVLSITGSFYKSVHSQMSFPNGLEHEDSLLAIGELGNSVQYSHVVNWISPTKERVTSVLGENGLIIADTLAGNLSLFEDGTAQNRWDNGDALRRVSADSVRELAVANVEPLVHEHEIFQAAIVTKDSSMVVSIQQGIEVLKVAERMISAKL